MGCITKSSSESQTPSPIECFDLHCSTICYSSATIENPKSSITLFRTEYTEKHGENRESSIGFPGVFERMILNEEK